jgi:hypothetical protein
MPRVIEMRTYKTKPGQRDEFVRLFRSKSVPAHEKIGMKIIGPFLAIEDPETVFWMRIFPDIASRAELKGQFYDSDLWKHDLEITLFPLLDKYDCLLIEDVENTFGSPGFQV